ncbi:MAG: 4Fe-4S dicluster domain-containing protein [Deltaproteobacteria bacterium]|nr:4Fe-4S dicluster domain-containing protein [Deltaproteobacteria bacterium]
MDRFIEDKVTKVPVKLEGEEKKADFMELKTGGFIKQRQKDLFAVRLRCPGGRITTEKLVGIAEIAHKYSKKGVIHLSFRQSLEVLYVDYKEFDSMIAELTKIGVKVASCGPRVRVPTACGGCEYNPNGLTDTQGFAGMVDKKYFGIPTPHKFKISFSGCPIDCARTREMDLGFQGVVEPEWDEPPCTGCTICSEACKEDAIQSDPDTGKPIYDPKKCLWCGDCIRACPTGAWRGKRYGHLVRIGGKHGRHPMEAREVALFVPDGKVPQVIEKTIEWYKQNGHRGERVGKTLERLGIEDYLKFMEPVFDGCQMAGREAVNE